jgi:hypothetical protein
MPRSARTCRCAVIGNRRRYPRLMRDEWDEVTHGYNSARRFQMWLYEVGHSQLLLRSVKNEDQTTRVDVLFKNVHSIQLPTAMAGMSISRSGQGFALEGKDWDGRVDAGACFVAEDDGEYFDPSAFAASLRHDP